MPITRIHHPWGLSA